MKALLDMLAVWAFLLALGVVLTVAMEWWYRGRRRG